MADQVLSFSDADLVKLRDTVDWVARQVRALQAQNEDPDIPQTPDVYIAYTPTTGIPALSRGANTGTLPAALVDDVPGKAGCDLYRLAKWNSPATMIPVGPLGYLYTVYNCFLTAVPGNVYVPVFRDKFGTAWVTSQVFTVGVC